MSALFVARLHETHPGRRPMVGRATPPGRGFFRRDFIVLVHGTSELDVKSGEIRAGLAMDDQQ